MHIDHAVVERMNLIPLNISRADMSCVFTTFTNLNETDEEEPHCQISSKKWTKLSKPPDTNIFVTDANERGHY